MPASTNHSSISPSLPRLADLPGQQQEAAHAEALLPPVPSRRVAGDSRSHRGQSSRR